MRGGLGLPGLLFEVTTLRAGPQFPGRSFPASARKRSASWLRSSESEHFPLVPPCALQVFLDPPKELSEFPSEAGI